MSALVWAFVSVCVREIEIEREREREKEKKITNVTKARNNSSLTAELIETIDCCVSCS